MLFSDYVTILRNHFKKTIGEYELCSILFDFVIEPADLLNSKNDVLTIPKSTVSKIMNNNAPINTQIRDNIYNDNVISSLVDNFNKHIVPELVPEQEDLCFQMVEQIRRDNISPSHKADFEMLAHPGTIGPFLAKVFMHAIVTNSLSSVPEPVEALTISTREPLLSIKGIDSHCRIIDYGVVEMFLSRTRTSLDEIRDEILDLYDQINAIHLPTSSPFGVGVTLFDRFKLDEKKKELIDAVAAQAGVELSSDFYEFGRLRKNPYDNLIMPLYGKDYASTLEGSSEEKKKAVLVNKLYKLIIEFADSVPFYDAFDKAMCISLALSNNGTDYDEDVRIDLAFDKNVLLTAEEIATWKKGALEYLVDKCDYDTQFEISKGIDYLSYEESMLQKFRRIPLSTHSFGYSEPVDYLERIKHLLGYYCADTGNTYSVQVKFDSINQHTAVAFPTIILLKDTVSNIPYTIKSKRMPSVIYGELEVR